jgi:hypothetical protein
MRPAISLLTAVTFWVHFVLGPCAHHAHGTEGPISLSQHEPASAAHHGHSHSHSHEHSAPVSEKPRSPCSHHDDSHETHSSFLLSGKSTVPADTAVAPLTMAIAKTVVPQAVSSSSIWLRDTGDHLRLPVRLHLLHQVWLI